MKTFVALIVLVGIAGGLWWYMHTSSNSRSPVVSLDGMNTGTIRLDVAGTADGGSVPTQYTCDTPQAVNPPITISMVPTATQSLVLLMNDPDVPKNLREDGNFDHWVVFNIPSTIRSIDAGTTIGTLGVNSTGSNTYVPPCPPPQYEPSEHRYVFNVYALDTMLDLSEGATRSDVLHAMEGHILDHGSVTLRYRRAAQAQQ